MTIPDYPERPISHYPNLGTQGAIMVAAHAVVDPNEVRKYFYSDLLHRGILPVLVIVENNDPQAIYVISKEQCALIDSAPVRSSDGVAADLSESRAALLVPFAADTMHMNNQNARENFESKEMKLLTILPGETIRGFVYFRIGHESNPSEQRSLRVRRLPRLGGDEVIEFLLPITLPASP